MKYPKATTTCKNSFSFKNKNKIQLKSVMDFVNFRDYQLGELIGTYFRCLAWKYFAFRYWVVLYWWKKQNTSINRIAVNSIHWIFYYIGKLFFSGYFVAMKNGWKNAKKKKQQRQMACCLLAEYFYVSHEWFQ